ncbi:hypothetical protein GWI33_001074 [Rhynchophorus ferrugineus]|uniref:Uncharacterized protein n=1 Tax=Rhynchophorus ferrugineus TaxID=354439 RepID=A0A834IQL4_RHYFE|nr:hypothetical protein GWI33_001074 [Rhynchophorus ferrugineus]
MVKHIIFNKGTDVNFDVNDRLLDLLPFAGSCFGLTLLELPCWFPERYEGRRGIDLCYGLGTTLDTSQINPLDEIVEKQHQNGKEHHSPILDRVPGREQQTECVLAERSGTIGTAYDFGLMPPIGIGF